MAEQPGTNKPASLIGGKEILFAGFAFILFSVLFTFFPPQAVDYHSSFYHSAGQFLQPYEQTGFISPPWLALILYPLQLFPENIGSAINCSLGLVTIMLLVISRKGDHWAVLMVLTSFPFLSMLSNGNIEWVPAIGFLLQNEWGMPFLLTKPQTGFLVVLAWMTNKRKMILFSLAGLLTILISIIVWGNWLSKLMANVLSVSLQEYSINDWNISLFPWTIPVGLVIVFVILKFRPQKQEILGCLATFCLSPYMAVYSLTIFYALLCSSYRKWGVILWVAFWLYPIVREWNTIMYMLGLT